MIFTKSYDISEGGMSYVLGRLEQFVARICPLIAFLLSVYVIIKYPKNKIAKIFLVLYIIGYIISAVFVLVMMYACNTSLNIFVDVLRDCKG